MNLLLRHKQSIEQNEAGYLVFDFTSFTYEFSKSEQIVLSKHAPTAPLELSVSQLPSGSGTKTTVVFLQFMQEVNGTMYPMKEVNSRVLEVVYVD